MMMSKISKILRILFWCWLVVAALPALTVFLLKFGFVQDKLKKYVESSVEATLKTRVDIGNIWLALPSFIVLEKTTIYDHHDKPLLMVEELSIDVNSLSIDGSFISVDGIKIKSPQFFLVTYRDESKTNLDIILSHLTDTTSTTQSSSSFNLKINKLNISEGRFVLTDLNKQTETGQHGIDFNQLDVQDIHLSIKDFALNDNKLSGFIEKLSFQETQSGFKLKNFVSSVVISDTLLGLPLVGFLTDSSYMMGSLSFHFNDWVNFNDFLDSVHLSGSIWQSRLHPLDLSCFVSEFSDFSLPVYVRGSISGRINDIVLRNVHLAAGMENEINLHGAIKNVTEINKVYLNNLIVKGKLSTSLITSLPGVKDVFNLQLSDTTKEKVLFNLFLDGDANDLAGRLYLTGFAGTLKTNFNLNFQSNGLNGFARCHVDDLKLNAFLFDLPINNISGNFDLDFTDLLRSYKIKGAGEISKIAALKNVFYNVLFDLALSPDLIEGKINIKDTFLVASTSGRVNLKQKTIAAQGQVNYFLLNAFALNREKNILTSCSGNFSFSLQGFEPDSMEGTFSGEDFFYREGERSIHFSQLDIFLDRTERGGWQLDVSSDFADIRAAGTKSISNVIPALQNLFSSYFPAIIQPVQLAQSERDTIPLVLDINANFHHVDSLFAFFKLDIITPKIDLQGKISENDKKFYFKVSSSDGKFYGVNACAPDLLIEGFNNKIFLTFTSPSLKFDNFLVQNTHLSLVQDGNQGNFSLQWHNNINKFEGVLNGSVFSNPDEYIVLFALSSISYLDSTYNIKDGSLIVYDSTGFRVKNMKIFTPNQSLELEGYVSSSMTEALQVTFSQVDIKQINAFVPAFPVMLEGSVNGYALLFNLLGNQPSYLADLTISKFKLNQYLLGDLMLRSSYDYDKNAISGNILLSYTGSSGTINPVHINGYYFLGNRNGELDAQVDVSRLNIAFVEPFLKGVMSKISGYAEGSFHITGNVNNPSIAGNLTLRRALFKIDYLNTFYSLSHTFYVNDTLIEGKNLVIFDALGNSASGDILIHHNRFNDFVIDIFLEPKNLQVLNTTASDNEYFYGKGAFTGVVKIKGPFDKISIDVAGKTEKGTQLFLPLNNPSSVYANDFIVFKTSLTDTVSMTTVSSTGVDVNLDLLITPDVEMQILFDPRVGDVIKGSAEGRIRIFVNDKGDMSMFGNLQIVKGDYLFTLQNLINKKFYVEPGGTIAWSGDPYEGLMDITARYALKTSLYQILSVVDESEQYKKKIPVHCMMYLKGKLLNPDITFDIVLPESDENTRNLLKSVISTDDELTRQFFALLTLNTFIPRSVGVTNTSLAMGASSTSFEMLSSQFSHWLSQISKDFNIDVSYYQGDQQSASQVEVAVGTQLFSDRLTIETNVQYGWGQTQMVSANQATALTGDVVIEYKVTKDGNFRIKAFNKSNTYDISTNSPYTQGVAFFYRKDFDKFRDLWIRKKKKTQ